MRLDVAVIALETGAAMSRVLDDLLGTEAWPQHVRDSVNERRFDGRWTMWVVAAHHRGELIGAMPVSGCRGGSIPDANLRAEFERRAPASLGRIDARQLMFLGGHAWLCGGVSLGPKAPKQDAVAVAEALVGAGMRLAGARRRIPVALFVPDHQLAPVTGAWRPPLMTTEAPSRAFLPVPPGSGIDAYLAALRRGPRQHWRDDLRRLERARIRADPVPVSDDLLMEAAPAIAHVKTRHGLFDHPRITEMRLRAWHRDVDPTVTRAWTVRDSAASLLGVSIGVVRNGVLTMVEIGLVEAHPFRRDFYLELAFHAPLRTCLSESLTGIDLGSGHPVPKLWRGAVLRRQWHVFAASVA